MPEPGQTWMAVGIDPATLLRRLLALHAALQPGAPDAGTLATKPGLEALRQGKYSSGGYATLSSYLDAAGPLAALAGALAGLTPTQLPHQGQTPILVTSSVTMDAAPRWTGTLRIPKDVFDDALARHGQRSGRAPVAPSGPFRKTKPSAESCPHQRGYK